MSPKFDPCAQGDLLPIEQALEQIVSECSPRAPNERIALSSALGRVLANDLVSERFVPPFDNSAMDGYALRSEDLEAEGATRLNLVGRSLAGKPFDGQIARGQAIRILTGAAMPEGADCVVVQEVSTVKGDSVVLDAQASRWANVRRRGDDVAPGATIIEAGRRMMPAQIAAAAAVGEAELWVHRRPRVAFFSTGDELVGIGQPLGPGQIFDSNRHALLALLRRQEVDAIDLGVVADNPSAVRAALQAAADCADLVLTTGGVSVGDTDYVKSEMEAIGELSFWKIAMKPGKPLAVGRIGDAHFFGLPGNPVSAMVTFYQFVVPALRRLSGEPAEALAPLTVKAELLEPISKKAGRTEFQRGILSRDDQGELQVGRAGGQGSHMLAALSRADCFIVLPRLSDGVRKGEMVSVQPFFGLA